jgi:hypothetical protein
MQYLVQYVEKLSQRCKYYQSESADVTINIDILG